MLDLYRLAGLLPDFVAHHAQSQQRTAGLMDDALAALDGCDACWEAFQAKAETPARTWLVARLREAPARRGEPVPRPTPITVVATDGSQVFPDRHREPHLYLLNVARLAFQYGTAEAPFIEAVPHLGYDAAAMQDLLDEVRHDATDEAISALRDHLELKALLETAQQTRVEGRPIVALADGTLIRWMLRAMRDGKLADHFVAEYAKLLEGFRDASIPVASYVSLPRNTEVINLLRLFREEAEEPGDDSLHGMLDRHLFERLLLPGERSAVFESSSKILAQYGGADRICYFYVHVPCHPGEVARVELPRWVAEDDGLVDLIHAVVLSECDKGRGYPMILSEAHERAVIRAREKEEFFRLVEHSIYGPGRPAPTSQKSAAKRAPMG